MVPVSHAPIIVCEVEFTKLKSAGEVMVGALGTAVSKVTEMLVDGDVFPPVSV